MNEIIKNNYASAEPVVGMGVTELCWSDRHAYTIIEIVGPKHIIVQRDKAIRTDQNGMSDMQDYSYESDRDGWVVHLSLRKDGHWRKVGQVRNSPVFMLGHREEYYDYSF